MEQQNGTEVLGGVIESPPSTRKGRRFVFTYFPKGDEDFYDPDNMQYCYYGVEECPTTKKIHYQGWCVFFNPRSERAVCKRYHAYMRIMGGTTMQNIKYCSKQGNVKTFGDEPRAGFRTDIEELKDKIMENKITVDDIALEQPIMFHKYGRTLNKIEDIVLRKKFRTWFTECDWIYGPSGVGKSHKAFEGYDPSTHYVYSYDNNWWDGYTGQDTVIINEFRGQIPYSTLLQMIDKFPFNVPRRGREPVPFLAKKIIITSCMTPKQVYHNLSENDNLDQLHRRINLIEKTSKTHFTLHS